MKETYIKELSVRTYQSGDEHQIVDFLNLCYGNWGTVSKWYGLYPNYPTFDKDNIFIFENKDEIVGHGGLFFRDLKVGRVNKICVALLGDAAINPRYRGMGLYSKLVEVRNQKAKSKGACLIFTWHLKGSKANMHNKKAGFIETRTMPAFMKAINPEKILKAGMYDFLHKNQKLREAIKKLTCDLHFCLGNHQFSIRDLLGNIDQTSIENRGKITFIFKESSIYTLANFRSNTKFRRICSFVLLVFLGKVKVKFSSLKTLATFIREGTSIFGTV